MRATDVPVMLTLAEAAETLRCTPRTIYNRRVDGTLRVVKVGGRVLVPLAEIERLADGGGPDA